MYRNFGKRMMDIFLSGIALIPLSVVYLILAAAIKIDDPGPVFFRQKRIGQDENGERAGESRKTGEREKTTGTFRKQKSGIRS